MLLSLFSLRQPKKRKRSVDSVGVIAPSAAAEAACRRSRHATSHGTEEWGDSHQVALLVPVGRTTSLSASTTMSAAIQPTRMATTRSSLISLLADTLCRLWTASVHWQKD